MFSFGLFLDNFVACYFGQQVESKSDNFCTRVFHSEWICGDRMFKQNLIILMERLKIPAKFSAKGIIDINLSTFIRVRMRKVIYF
jgi:hypothetical protein